MRSMVAAAAAGTDQPAATAAKIKTASHTKFRTRPAAGTDQPAATAPKIKTASHTKFRTRPGTVRRSFWRPATPPRRPQYGYRKHGRRKYPARRFMTVSVPSA